MQPKSPKIAILVFVIGALFLASSAFSDVVVTFRESFAELDLLVQAGGAVSNFNQNDTQNAHSGSLDFSVSETASVTENDPFSNGSGTALGGINVSDNVSIFGNQGLAVSMTRGSAGSAIYGSGPSTTSSSWMRHRLYLEFSVTDADALFSLTGNFDPGAASNGDNFSVGIIKLGVPFDPSVVFEYSSASVLNSSGTLTPGNYFLDINMSDSLSASVGNAFQSDASSLDLQFTVGSVLLLGDANGDGVFNNGDIASFVLALTNAAAYQAMYPNVDPDVVLDMNGDGFFNNGDIGGFVAALTGGGTK